VTFSIVVNNNGPSDAMDLSVTERLSSGYTFVSADVPNGTSYDAASGVWTVGNLANGANVTLTIVATVNRTGSYLNTVTLNASTIDPAPSNNTSTSTPLPVPNRPLAEDDIVAADANKPTVIRVTDNDDGGVFTLDLSSIEIVDFPKNGKVTVNSDGTIIYVPNPGYVGDDTFTYRLKDKFGNYTNVATVTIKSNFIDLKIPNLFTPNGDGQNDTFEIRGLNQFAQNNLVIINRWGNEVYQSNNYNNTWTGEGLNEGTYYYLLKVKLNNDSDWTTYKGWLTLIRTFRK
jgi:gliding motility-associated-like protein/uncharacterized repeat protein (TIGR01451 family)